MAQLALVIRIEQQVLHASEWEERISQASYEPAYQAGSSARTRMGVSLASVYPTHLSDRYTERPLHRYADI